MFGENWNYVAGVLDAASARQIISAFSLESAAYIAPVQGYLEGSTEEGISIKPPAVDWTRFWKSFSTPDVLNKIIDLQHKTLLTPDINSRIVAYREHARFVCAHVEGLPVAVQQIEAAIQKLKERKKKIGKIVDSLWETVGIIDLMSGKNLAIPLKMVKINLFQQLLKNLTYDPEGWLARKLSIISGPSTRELISELEQKKIDSSNESVRVVEKIAKRLDQPLLGIIGASFGERLDASATSVDQELHAP